MEDPDYRYEPRKIEDMPERAFVPGEGRISGYLSSALGVMSFFGVLCFLYPSWLTTEDLRGSYNVGVLRMVLQASMWTSLFFGFFTFVRWRRKRLGAVGLLFTFGAFALGGWNVEVGELKDAPVTVGLDWLLLDLLGSAALFIFIEKIVPKYPEQPILRPDWRLDLAYFATNHLAIGALLLVGNRFAPWAFGWAVNASVQDAIRSLPVWAQVILLILCADFVLYWMHRAFHEVRWLWPIHAVHHSTEYLDWLSGSRNHTLETFIDRTLAMVPLYLIGPDQEALDAYVIFAGFQAGLTHANVGIPFGPLKYIIATPQFHHWHHSSEKPAIDTNYGVHTTVFDLLFRTFHMPGRAWPAHYGTVSPIPKTYLGQMLHPFRPSEWS